MILAERLDLTSFFARLSTNFLKSKSEDVATASEVAAIALITNATDEMQLKEFFANIPADWLKDILENWALEYYTLILFLVLGSYYSHLLPKKYIHLVQGTPKLREDDARAD